MTKRLPIEAAYPTQLSLSSEKLAGVFEWFDFDSPNDHSLPAFDYDGDWSLSDGHSRAFAAELAGAETLCIEEDDAVREEYDFEVYRQCIQWCADAGVESISDLSGRVVEPETYETRWIGRYQSINGENDGAEDYRADTPQRSGRSDTIPVEDGEGTDCTAADDCSE
jgi:hypothetical protein